MHTNFGWLDGAIIIVYLGLLAGIGVYFSRRHQDMESFFLAGRSMGWLPIGMSLMAALNSGIDYIATPSTTIKYGLIFTVSALSWVLLYPWVVWITLPFYRRLQVFTAYEYLERRFGVSVRTLAAGIFLLWRIGWMGTAMYVPCLAISAVTGGRIPLLPTILVLGVIVTTYTMLGGINAVIWTDVLQFCIMLTGLTLTIAVILFNIPGGIGEVWRLGAEAGKTHFTTIFTIADGASIVDQITGYFQSSTTFSGILIAAVVGRMALYCSDQVMVQRFQTTRSLTDARRAFVINAVGDALWTVGLSFVGLALFAYFQLQALPQQIRGNTDQIFPYFISNVFPTGVIGLVIAAILAASLSSIDSAINSCTSVFVVDLYGRLIRGERRPHGPAAAVIPPDPSALDDENNVDPARDQRHRILISRWATVAFGIIGMTLAANVGRIGIVLEIGNKVIQSFTGPLLGIYLLGMFTQRARSGGVLAGGVTGTLVAIYVAFFSTIGFIWPTVFGLIATLVPGYALSLFMPGSPSEAQRQLTWRNVMRRPLADETPREASEPVGATV